VPLTGTRSINAPLLGQGPGVLRLIRFVALFIAASILLSLLLGGGAGTTELLLVSLLAAALAWWLSGRGMTREEKPTQE
jgi:hypothetical protein